MVVEENGYYSAWRSNPMQSQMMNQLSWPGFMNPQSYLPFNFNPFSWWQSQQAQLQEEVEKEIIRDRQTVMFDILRCMVNEENKENCKMMLMHAMKLFPEMAMLERPAQSEVKPPSTEQEMTKEKCAEEKPDMKTEVKPLEIINLGVDSLVTQEKPSKTPHTMMNDKPLEDRMSVTNEEVEHKEETKAPEVATEATISKEEVVTVSKNEEATTTKEEVVTENKNEDATETTTSREELVTESVVPAKDESVESDKKPSQNHEKTEEEKLKNEVIKVMSEKPLENKSIMENQQTATVLPDKSMNSETASSDKNPVEDKSSVKETELANS